MPSRTIRAATDERGALDLATRYAPRLALIGHRLPEINALELTTQIRGMLPDTFVIVILDNNSDHLEARALAVAGGAYGCVHKDHMTTELLPMITQCLDAGEHDVVAERKR